MAIPREGCSTNALTPCYNSPGIISPSTQPDLLTTTLSGTQPSTPASLSSILASSEAASGSLDYSIAAVLTEASTTITAFQVPGSTGVAVVDGTTLSGQNGAITLSNGDVLTIGHNGLEGSDTTVPYSAVTVTNDTVSSTTGPAGNTATASDTGSSATGAASSSASASSTASSGAASIVGVGKTVALLCAIGGMLAYTL